MNTMTMGWTRRRFVCLSLPMVMLGIGGCSKCDASAVSNPYSESWRPAYDAWEEDDPIPAFSLADQEGRHFSLERYDDSYLLIGFVLTRCNVPKACPLTMKRMSEVQSSWKALKAEGRAQGRKLSLLTITLDPEFDTPPLMKTYASGYGADFSLWTMATGHEELVSSAIPSLFNVLALPDGTGSIRHSVKVALLGPGREFLKDWGDNDFEPHEVLSLVTGEPSRD